MNHSRNDAGAPATDAPESLDWRTADRTLDLRRLLTSDEVASILAVDRRTLLAIRARGELAAVKLGATRNARVRFRPGDVAAFIERSRRIGPEDDAG